MIIQTAREGQPHFVIKQADHARMSGQFARVFGNDQFAPLNPSEPMEFIAAHHDEGWVAIDDAPSLDSNTRLPYHLTQTPLPLLLQTGAGSPNFNEAHHPYSGLISSMHTWGLYHGRYGLSDRIVINMIPAEHRPAVDSMLDAEVERQERLKAQLRADPASTPSVEENTIFHNYKLLQFFDTLALYFNMTHDNARGEATFANVPLSVGNDTTITIQPAGAGIYRLSPYPLAQDNLEVYVEGRYLSPLESDVALTDVMRATPIERQRFTLVAGE